MKQDLAVRRRWLEQGKRVGAATVARVSGSAPRPVGARFLMTPDGEMAGSVSGGCVENDVFIRLQEIVDHHQPRLVGYGIADEEAFEVGLACGGQIEVYLEDQTDSTVLDAAEGLVEREGFGSLVVMVGGPHLGQTGLLEEGNLIAGSLPNELLDSIRSDADQMLSRGTSLTLDYQEHQVYVESLAPRPRLLIFGAVHIAQELVPIARRLGYRVIVSDARAAFLTAERFPDADQLLPGWPDQVELPLDRATAVVVLSHDARFEDPLWPRLLASEVAYIGAMGSKKTAARRRQRLSDLQYPDDQIDRIHGPIGLEIGAESPAEVAVAIMAEVIRSTRRPDRPLELIGQARRLPGN